MKKGWRKKAATRVAGLSRRKRLALLIGEDSRRPVFKSRELMKREWRKHREELLRQCNPGCRPTAWWIFQADGVDRFFIEGLGLLIQWDELRPDEVEKLRPWWPAWAEQAWQKKHGGVDDGPVDDVDDES